MTRHTLSLLIIAIALTGCAALGSRTLYKSTTKPEIKKLAFAKLDRDNIVSSIFPQTDSIFMNTVTETFRAYKFTDVTSYNADISINNADGNEIAQICNENNFDGLIVSHLKFIHVSYSSNFGPIVRDWDTEVEMKLFDKTGNLVLRVLHNTAKGNSYFLPPTASRTVYDGTAGAIRKIAKELGLTR